MMGSPLQVKALCRGATTSSGRFAATVRGCRPPFAENSPPDFFPGAPGPQPGEGNTGCRPPFAENSALHFFPCAPGPQPGEGNTGCRPPFAENSALHFFPCAPGPQPGEGNTGSRPPFAENSPPDFLQVRQILVRGTRAAPAMRWEIVHRTGFRHCDIVMGAVRKTS